MKPHRRRSLLLATVTLAAALFGNGCEATLGEKESSIEANRAAIAGTREKAVVEGKYRVHVISNPRLTIREFAGNDGTIFAVAWNGVTHPDLKQFLGSYFADYESQSIEKPRREGRRMASVVRGAKVVVEKRGRMRAAQGRAYVPTLLPEGVTADEIK